MDNSIDIEPAAKMEQKKRETYVTYVSADPIDVDRSALIDSGAVHTIIGTSTLDKIMNAHGIVRVEKCNPLAPIHRFGTAGAPIEPEFGAIIPWRVKDMEGDQHDFNLRADVLEGDQPLLIGCPTLMVMKSSLDFCELKTRCAYQRVTVYSTPPP
jgi:hypothetical protein